MIVASGPNIKGCEKRLGWAVEDRAGVTGVARGLDDLAPADCARPLAGAAELAVLSLVRLGCRRGAGGSGCSGTLASARFGGGGLCAGGSEVAGVSSCGAGVASGVGMAIDDGSCDDVCRDRRRGSRL